MAWPFVFLGGIGQVGSPLMWRVDVPVEPFTFVVSDNPDDVVYAFTDSNNVPEGIYADLASLTVYGTPKQAGTFEIGIQATRPGSGATAFIFINISVAEAYTDLYVPALPEIVFRLPPGQGTDTRPVSFTFPEPQGGSGNFTTAIEYRPTGRWTGRQFHNTFLPEGLTYNSATRTLSGNIVNSTANIGQSLAQVTLNNAQVWGHDNQFTGHNPGEGSSLSGSSFNYPAFTGKPYRWQTIFTYGGPGPDRSMLGGLRVGIEPDIEDAPNQLPNSPNIFILDSATNQVLSWFPVSMGSETLTEVSEDSTRDLVWQRNEGRTSFRFEEGRSYFVEIATSPRNNYNYVITDNTTGQVLKVPFSLLLIASPEAVPETPVLEDIEVGITNVAVTLASTDDASIANIVAGQTGEGFPAPHSSLRSYPYNNVSQNRLVISGLEPNTDYDFYVFYEDSSDVRSLPLIVTRTTLPAHPHILPLPLTGLFARSGNNRLHCFWDDIPAFQNILKIEIKINNGPWRDIPHSTSVSTGYVVPGLVNGAEATIKFRVVNDVGTSPEVSVTGTPGGDYESPFSLPCQSRVYVDFDNVFLPLQNRVLSAEGETGRQPGSFDTAPGWATVQLLATDGLVRLVSPSTEHQGLYSAADLRNRRCLIVELYETATGRLETVTRFGGWIEEAPFDSRGEEQIISLSITDRLAQYARRPVSIKSVLPRETAEDRCRRLISEAGVAPDEIEIRPNRIICSQVDASARTPYTGTLLGRLTDIAVATGGRIYVKEDQKHPDTDTPTVGKIVVEPSTTGSAVVATLSDQPDLDKVLYPDLPVGELHNQPPAVLDASNLYNTVSLTLEDGSFVSANDAESVSRWGGKLFPVSKVPVDQEGAEALARFALRVYSQPKFLSDRLLAHLHFQQPEPGLALARATRADSLRLSFQPPSGDRIIRQGKIDKIRWQHIPGDKQYCGVILEFGLIDDDASQYWIVNQQGADALGTETWLAPALPGDNDLTGFQFDTSGEGAVVSADRFNSLLSKLGWPVYTSTTIRDRYEHSPFDGQPCMMFLTATGGQKSFRLVAWSAFDNQWLPVAQLSVADANPTITALVWDEGAYDDSKVWA